MSDNNNFEVFNYAVNEILDGYNKQIVINKILIFILLVIISLNGYLIYQNYKHHKEIWNVYFSLTRQNEKIHHVQINNYGSSVTKE